VLFGQIVVLLNTLPQVAPVVLEGPSEREGMMLSQIAARVLRLEQVMLVVEVLLVPPTAEAVLASVQPMAEGVLVSIAEVSFPKVEKVVAAMSSLCLVAVHCRMVQVALVLPVVPMTAVVLVALLMGQVVALLMDRVVGTLASAANQIVQVPESAAPVASAPAARMVLVESAVRMVLVESAARMVLAPAAQMVLVESAARMVLVESAAPMVLVEKITKAVVTLLCQ
jgi:hypothetical protein